MEHRYDPSYERDDRDERSRDREHYRSLSRRDFQPGNDGFQESGRGGEQGQYGGSGSDHGYGQSRYAQYRGFERSRDRDRWGEQRDDWGDPSRSDTSSGSYRPGASGPTGYGASQSDYGSSLYGQRSGRGEWEPRERYGDRDREGWRTGRSAGYGGFGEQRGLGERGRDRPGFFQRLFKRGPKGYQRSDERLREDISERLMYAMEIDSSEVTVTVNDGRVTLDGTVPDRYMKHAIEDLVDECPGVQDIDNRVRVQREGVSTSLSGTATSDVGTSPTSRTGGATTGSQSRRPS